MRSLVLKLVSLAIALAYLVAASVAEGGVTLNVGKLCLVLLIPLALIWFADELGGFTGYTFRGPTVDEESPGILVAGMGWFFLVGIPIVAYAIGQLTRE